MTPHHAERAPTQRAAAVEWQRACPCGKPFDRARGVTASGTSFAIYTCSVECAEAIGRAMLRARIAEPGSISAELASGRYRRKGT